MQLTRVCSLVLSASLAAAGSHGQWRRQATDILPSYDYIVVGSGPGGGPLATRLALAGKSVLLIDAGDDHGDAVLYQVPALSLQSTEYAPMRWDYYVNHYSNLTYQKLDSKMTYKTPTGSLYVGLTPPAGSTPLGILYPRAGALGGCSAHNAEISVYPHASDWNYIATLTGDSTWSASNMRQYFARLEKCTYLPNSIVGHGFTGWFTTSLTDLTLVVQDPKLLRTILNAVLNMGQGGLLTWLINTVTSLSSVLIMDLNADSPTRDQTQGVYQMPIAVGDGFRSGPRQFMLDTAAATNPDGTRKYKLDIALNTFVTKVRFDTSGAKPKAIGVDFLRGANLYRADPASGSAAPGIPGSVDATSEVIISAGAFNTPQLLKLSGIGPAAELAHFNIPLVANLPGVGTNMQDRYETTVIGQTGSDFEVIEGCTFYRTPDDPCYLKWKNGLTPTLKGVYASNGIALAIVRKSSQASSSDDPDTFVAGAPVGFKGYYRNYSADATVDARHWTWLVLKAHSRNRAGTVMLRSCDPLDTPLIDFNSFQNDADGKKDVQAVVEGMNWVSGLLGSVGGMTQVWPPPGAANTNAKMAEWVRREAWGHHASCTCPIGADGDPMAVLDSKFRVRGVDSLRVVDASAYPKIPGFFIAVPTYMLSEKAADVILAGSA